MEVNKSLIESSEVKQPESIENISIDTLYIREKEKGYLDVLGWIASEDSDTNAIRTSNTYQNNHHIGGYKYRDKNKQFTFIQEKLQEYYDLLLLEKNNPEFGDEVRLQLDRLANFKVAITPDPVAISMQNIQYLSAERDKKSKLIQYKIMYRYNQQLDSLKATVVLTKLKVSTDTVFDHKIHFEPFN
jgi:hypothetical protein